MRILVATFLMALPASSLAAPLTPWGLHTGAGETWLRPYLFVDREGLSNRTYLSIGLGPRFDLIGGVGIGYSDHFEPGAIEATPRMFVTEAVGVGVRIASVPGRDQLEMGPELHAAWSVGPLALTGNVGWRPVVGADNTIGQAFAILAPELFVSDTVSLFAEVNPSLGLESGEADLTVVPGLGLDFGEQSVAVGAVLPIGDLGRWTLGGWTSFRLGSTAR